METTDAVICSTTGITMDELSKAQEVERSLNAPQDMMARMKAMQASTGSKKHSTGMGNSKIGGMSHPAMASMSGAAKEYNKEEKELARVIMELERTIRNVGNYKAALENCPETEFASLLNAMDGGYTAPSPGGAPPGDGAV